MLMRTIIYCGPSLSRTRLNEITDADIAPPIRRGDLESNGGYEVYVILDGEFSQSLSVSPKEILQVLDRGKVVIGAASMGALRAAEMAPCGMIGVGWIYERFAAAAVRREDDVALAYSPLDGAPCSVPMVNIEYWTETLEAKGHLSRKERAVAVRAARRVFFADRTKARLMSALEQALGRDRLDSLLDLTGGEIPDIKAADAELAIRFAANLRTETSSSEQSRTLEISA